MSNTGPLESPGLSGDTLVAEPETQTTKEGLKEKKGVEDKETESNEAEKEIVERKDLDVAAVEE